MSSKPYLAPVLLGFLLCTAAPIIAVFGLAGVDWNLIGPAKWVGFDNFAAALGSSDFGSSLAVTLEIALITTVLQVLASTLLGYFLAGWNRTTRMLSAIYLLPWLTAPLAIGVIWKWLLAPTGGLLSQLLGFRLDVLTNPIWAPFAIAAVSAWAGTGFSSLIFSSALRSVRANTVDAAILDGASSIQVLWHVQLPQMRRILFFIILSITLQSMTIYDLAFVLGTDTASKHIVDSALKTFQIGSASAMSILFTITELVIIAAEYLVFRLLTRRFDD